MLTISGKALGRKKPLFANWSVPLPPLRDGEGTTLRDVISHVVRSEVQAFHERQEQRQILHALTARDIEAGAAKGKIAMGETDVPKQVVDEDEAIGTALQAFEDGMYLVVLDGEEQRSLERQVFLQPDSRVTFIRLTLLAGG